MKSKYSLLLGLNDGKRIQQIVSKKRFRKGWWKSYYLIDNKKVYSNKVKKEIMKNYHTSLSYIALRLCDGCDTINYVGEYYNYLLWEAWKEDDDENKTTYVFFDSQNYIVLTDEKKIEELKAYLLLRERK